jgi:hypothetical protein
VRVHIDREKIKLLWNCVLRKDAGNVGLKEEMAMEVDWCVLLPAVEQQPTPAELVQHVRLWAGAPKYPFGSSGYLGAHRVTRLVESKFDKELIGRLHASEDTLHQWVLVMLRQKWPSMERERVEYSPRNTLLPALGILLIAQMQQPIRPAWPVVGY